MNPKKPQNICKKCKCTCDDFGVVVGRKMRCDLLKGNMVCRGCKELKKNLFK